jgi:hypothetical protein
MYGLLIANCQFSPFFISRYTTLKDLMSIKSDYQLHTSVCLYACVYVAMALIFISENKFHVAWKHLLYNTPEVLLVCFFSVSLHQSHLFNILLSCFYYI